MKVIFLILLIIILVVEGVDLVRIIIKDYKFNKLVNELVKPEEIKIKLIENGKEPEYKREGDACLDCKARQSITIPKGKRELVPLGFAMELPKDYEAIVRPRSGNTKNGIDIGIGTVDETYRGELKACVINDSDEDFHIEEGDRICQLAIREAPKFKMVKVSELSKTERNESGFGSSGKK